MSQKGRSDPSITRHPNDGHEAQILHSGRPANRRSGWKRDLRPNVPFRRSCAEGGPSSAESPRHKEMALLREYFRLLPTFSKSTVGAIITAGRDLGRGKPCQLN